jgi:putative two-component system response regulator
MYDIEPKILIVYDEPDNCRRLHLELSSLNFRCSEAESASTALALMKTHEFSLIITDLRVPDISGLKLLGLIKSQYPDISVIIATGVTEMDMAVQCMKHGADDYLCQPFDLEQLISSLRRSIEKRDLRLKVKAYQNSLEEKIQWQNLQIHNLFLAAIESLVMALEAKDKYTAGHSRRVTDFSLKIGSRLSLSPDFMEDLRWASMLHDVGKIAVDQLIQNKPDRLTHEEYEHIMVHAHVGAGIVRPVVNNRVMEMIEHHHDRYDGQGLHQTVKGETIPLGARILAVADAFDAMTSDRPYRRAMHQEDALEEISHCSGSQFDSLVAKAFLKSCKEEKVPLCS